MRVLLFLLLTTAAAAEPIRCLAGEDYGPVDAWLRYDDSPYTLVRIPRPRVKGMRRMRIDDVAVYARQEKREGGRVLTVFAERDGIWYQLREDGAPPSIDGGGWRRPQTEKPPVVTRAKRGLPIIRVTWVEQWMGANRAGLTRSTVFLDFRAKPRVLLSIDCNDAGGGGACTAPDAAHEPRHELTCDDDLRCTMRESLFIDWTTRSAARKFDLLTNRTIAPSRFDAVRYASGAAFAAAGPEAVRQRALIDGIGIVQPVFEVSRGRVLFAAHAREPVATFRFFLLDRGTWREIPRTLLTDSVYPGDARDAAGSMSKGFTPDAPQLVFSAWDLDLPGKRKLIEVLGTEGEARSIHWIMLDPGGRTGALRVATNQPEWRHCGNVVYPLTATALGIPDRGLPAVVQAIAPWRSWDIKDAQLPRTCNLVGTIDWSSTRGWIVQLGQAPCTDPVPRPYFVAIDEEGQLWVEAPKSRE